MVLMDPVFAYLLRFDMPLNLPSHNKKYTLGLRPALRELRCSSCILNRYMT